ncbi:MAG TPA: B12-binding domain-containing radical SAM protein [Thermoplasmata archaeon]|nr:B12-binding domain-containing radical SAM protein [Thermoplasmata archaeon]
MDELGIDMLFHGEAEAELVPLVRDILDGRRPPRTFTARRTDHRNIPPILAPGTYGSVEITRGCGRGCHFCSPTMRRRHSVPMDLIMREVALTVDAGVDSIFILTEDLFLYRTHDHFIPNRGAIVELVRNIAEHPGVGDIHISHCALAPIVYDPKILEETSPYLLEHTRRRYNGEPFVTAEVGVETGSRRLMRRHMAGKSLPYNVDDWPELVIEGIGNMNDHRWFPLITMMTGPPDETEDDVIATLELIDELRDMKIFFTPLLFIPLKETALARDKRINLENLSELQFEFIARSWKYNIHIWGDTVNTPIRVRTFAPPLFLAAFFLWARWKHGRNLTRPLLKLAGFPDDAVGGYVGRWADPRYAVPESRKPRYPIQRGKPLRPAIRLAGPGDGAGGGSRNGRKDGDDGRDTGEES